MESVLILIVFIISKFIYDYSYILTFAFCVMWAFYIDDFIARIVRLIEEKKIH